MRKRQRQVNRYVRAVGSYLPCAGKHKKQLLTALRSEAEAYCAETRDADLEARFGTPQQVAAAYVDAMSTQELLAAREKFVDEAKRDVERMMRQADLEAKSKVSDSEVLYAAKEKARKIIADAEDRSRQLCQVANEYAEDALARTEEAVQAALTEVKQSRSAFRAASAAKLQEQREKLEAERKTAEEAEN